MNRGQPLNNEQSLQLTAQADGLEKIAPKPGEQQRADAARLVHDYIRDKRAAGIPIKNLTRDGIATALSLPARTVSNTKAWKALAIEKRQAKAPANDDEAVLRAARAGDWKAVGAAQRQEERRNRRGGAA